MLRIASTQKLQPSLPIHTAKNYACEQHTLSLSLSSLIWRITAIAAIKQIILETQSNAVRSVDFQRVMMYWRLGERILVEEQRGQVRAEYGTYLIKNLAVEIEPEFGSGFGSRQLHRARQFYRTYPIVSALRSQLNWSQYRMLIAIEDDYKREYYELEAVNNGWTGRELERQINACLLVSKDTSP